MESILAPHAGKVVVVDFWNTWCGICRKISSQMEPKKSAELASDDIVWIYVADESSDKKEYDKLIKDMKGIHIYLTQSQREEVFNYFNLDGFPSFILAERDGSYQYRSDFLNVDTFEYELRKRIGKKVESTCNDPCTSGYRLIRSNNVAHKMLINSTLIETAPPKCEGLFCAIS